MNISSEQKDTPLVLIVDDDKFMRTQLRHAMEDVGYQVAEASDGEEGLAAYTHLHPDIVLLDALMPAMDGFTCCSLIQRLPKGDSTPVLMITGLEDQESVDRAFEVGATDFITKPIHWAVLRQRVRRILEASRATAELRQQTERAQLSEQKIREQAALLDITTDAILVRNLSNQILFWNKGAEHLYGWKAHEAIGKNANELLYREQFHQLAKIQSLLIQKGEWQGELSQVTKDGNDIIVEGRWTLVLDDQKQPKSILTVNTDITEKKKLEKQFLRAQRMESIGTLASGITHDLNNALAPILMSVQLLEKKLHDEQSQWLLKTLETNTKRSADLVRQVLAFVRGFEGECTTLDVGSLISEVEQIIKQTFPRAIEIDKDIVPDLWAISGDATQLHQVLINLCVNARDALPNGGVLSLSAQNLLIDENYARMNIDAQIGSYIVIIVSDTGMGIPPEILDRIFEPFFTTKKFGLGTGLGLSTVAGIVKGHGGFVDVYSEVGGGTQFKVYLPATETAQIEQVKQKEYQLPEGHGELILVVDDEPAICEVTKTSLETYAYRVITASDGIEAIVQYAQHKDEISAVLLDMMMPSMDGPTTIRTVQKINPQVKIIAVSGLLSDEKIAEVTHAGVKTFLPKPYTTETLLTTLQSVLQGNSNSQGLINS